MLFSQIRSVRIAASGRRDHSLLSSWHRRIYTLREVKRSPRYLLIVLTFFRLVVFPLLLSFFHFSGLTFSSSAHQAYFSLQTCSLHCRHQLLASVACTLFVRSFFIFSGICWHSCLLLLLAKAFSRLLLYRIVVIIETLAKFQFQFTSLLAISGTLPTV